MMIDVKILLQMALEALRLDAASRARRAEARTLAEQTRKAARQAQQALDARRDRLDR